MVGYTQSGLTHLVNSLEREIGFPLIDPKSQWYFPDRTGEGSGAGYPSVPAGKCQPGKSDSGYYGSNRRRLSVLRRMPALPCSGCRRFCTGFARICPKVDVDLRMVDHALEPFELLQERKDGCDLCQQTESYRNCEWIPLYHELLYAILPKALSLKWAQRISASVSLREKIS